MDDKQLDALKTRFSFDSWSGTNRLGREVVARKLVAPKGLFEGLVLERARDIDVGDGARLLRATFISPSDAECMITMDAYECDSRQAAHLVLLELLDHMQAPDVERLDSSRVGDVCFGRGKPTVLLFARCNVAVLLRNGGRNVVEVDRFAAAADDWIIDSATPD